MNAAMWVAGPGVHRTGDDRAMWVKATLHALGAAVGGAILGAGVAQLGAALSPADRAAAGSLLGAALAVVSMLRLPVLERNTETPQSLLRLGSVGWSVANGALLGTAVTNRIGYWLWYAVPIGCFVSGEPLAGAAIWGVFVCARLATIIVVARAMIRRPDRAPLLADSLLALRSEARAVMTALAVVTGTLIVLLLGL